MKYFFSFLFVFVAVFAFSGIADAKGGGGGGRGGGFRSSVSRPSVKPSSPKPVSNVATKPTPQVANPVVQKVSTKPTATTKSVASVTPVKSATGKKMSGVGKVVDDKYQPKLQGGASVPVGSVVYYQQPSMLSYLPFYMIMMSGSHRDVVVQTPDGKQTTQKEEALDKMYVLNWVVSILLVLGLGGLLVWFVNKKTNV